MEKRLVEVSLATWYIAQEESLRGLTVMIGDFIEETRCANEAGCDGLELHGVKPWFPVKGQTEI